jgi:hypothetical protein
MFPGQSPCAWRARRSNPIELPSPHTCTWARAAAALVLAATTAGARAQSSYFSATGTFTAAPDAAQRFVVDFHNAAETNFRTWAWSGGVNAAGNTIPNNGIDSALWFSGGIDFDYVNDDISPGNRDSLLTIPPNEAQAGTLELWHNPANSVGRHWAVDMTRNGGFLARRFASTNSSLTSFTWGGSSPGIAKLRLGVGPALVTTGRVEGRAGSSFELVSGGRLSAGSDFALTGVGTMSAGTLAVNNTEYMNGSMHQSGGMHSSGTLYVGESGPGATYRLSGGTLNTFLTQVGRFASGTFTQDGGANTIVNTLRLAESSGVTGRYFLNNGSLQAGWLEVGFSGDGALAQTGGFAAFTNALIGRATTASGRYDLGGGTLLTSSVNIGQHGPGTFTHSNGHHSAGSVSLGETTFGDGLYLMNSGSLTATADIRLGRNGSGRMIQSGGSVSASGQVLLGAEAGRGTYTMNGGTLDTTWLKPGFQGAGTFIHNGGFVNPGEMVIGEGTAAVGRYNLSGTGSIVTNNVYVAVAGQGRMIHTGGTMDVTGWFTLIGRDAGSAGVYEQSGGAHRTTDLYLGYNPGSAGTYELSGGVVSSSFNTFVGDKGAGTFLQSGGTHNAQSMILAWSPAASGFYQLAGGTLHVNGDMVVNPGGSVGYSAGRFRAGTLEIRGGRVLLTGGADKVVRVGAVEVPSGQLDLADNAAVIDYTGTSPLADIRGYLAGGHNGGSWNGSGINSSSAAAEPGHGLGYAEASAIFTSFPATFAGESVDDTSILIRYARYGDANLDGSVNLADFNRLAASFGSSGATWSQGDFTYDGFVNLNDFNRLAANFGLGASGTTVTPDDWAALSAAVPEPAGAGAAVMALSALVRRARRVRRRATILTSPDPFRAQARAEKRGYIRNILSATDAAE